MNQEEQPECRICGEGAEGNSRLFSPCLCRGSMKYIHINCLEHWRELSPNRNSKYRCDQCRYEYRLDRVWWTRLIDNPWTASIITLLAITITVAIVGYFLKYAAFLLFGVRHGRSVWMLSRQLVWWSILLIGVVTMIMLMIAGARDGNGPALEGIFQVNLFHPQAPFIYEWMGYTFSLGGFGIFIGSVYGSVNKYTNLYLARVSRVVLEVQVS